MSEENDFITFMQPRTSRETQLMEQFFIIQERERVFARWMMLMMFIIGVVVTAGICV